MPTLAPLAKTFDFDEVMLVPKTCQISSRGTVDTTVSLGTQKFLLPVVPANMSTILDESLATFLAKNGYFYVMHRFNIEPLAFIKRIQDKNLYTSISIGIQDSDFAFVKTLKELERPVDYITIDIAHGDHPKVFKLVELLKTVSPKTFIIAGNVATPQATKTLEASGADAIKIGIGPGSACLTSPHTGFGTRGWQLSAIQWCAEAVTSAAIIADGGIRNHGDIAKAIAFGADMVMIGGMFAGHDESPGSIQEVNGKNYKIFFGSASAEQKGNSTNVEGKSMLVEYRGPILNTLQAIKENLQSAISYSGGTQLKALEKSDFVFLK